jgi:hypothetical protein
MAETSSRIDWVDYGKGICIILVVFMHSTLGVENALGLRSWLHGFIEWARPFRMPDFFMLSGLFLASRIDRPWRAYLDSKLLHFAYFYVLWMTIQFALKAPSLYGGSTPSEILAAYAWGFVDPYATLWFIYLLAVFFLVVKALHWAPPAAIFLGSAVLESLAVETGYVLLDEFAARFVYFYSGYLFASRIFAFAGRGRIRAPRSTCAGIDSLGCLERMAGEGRRRGITHRQPCPGLCRLGSSDHGGSSASALALGKRSALLRRELHRHLSGLRALHGTGPHPADQIGPHHRSRARGDGCHGGKRCRPADPVPHHTRHPSAFLVHSARDVPSHALAKESVSHQLSLASCGIGHGACGIVGPC